ncbi:hypothetical protein BP5796_09111 [Coleophoma crateriformis]|uniref:Uncharacterized protein n=1 Tax=Coleophoma crateriformis TaxID=565419 RepID=A0A3D8R3R5_9HELO|nr:hypothetical protein BP5796_09111 [Coleophoma crateriformis]
MFSYQLEPEDSGGGFDPGQNPGLPSINVGYLPTQSSSLNLTTMDLDPRLQAQMEFPGGYHCHCCAQAMPHWSDEEKSGMNLGQLQLHLNNVHGISRDSIPEIIDSHVAQLLYNAGYTKQVQYNGPMHCELDYTTGLFIGDPHAVSSSVNDHRIQNLSTATNIRANPQFQPDAAAINTYTEPQYELSPDNFDIDVEPQYQPGDSASIRNDIDAQHQSIDATSLIVHKTPPFQHQSHLVTSTRATSTTNTIGSNASPESGITHSIEGTGVHGAKEFVCELCSKAMPDTSLPQLSKDQILDHGRKFHRLEDNEFDQLLPDGGFTCQVCAEAMPNSGLPTMNKEMLEQHAYKFHRLNNTELPEYFQSAVIAILNATDDEHRVTTPSTPSASRPHIASQPAAAPRSSPFSKSSTPKRRYATAVPLADRPSAKTVFGGPRQPRNSISTAPMQAQSSSITNTPSASANSPDFVVPQHVVFRAIVPPPSTTLKKNPGRRKATEVEDKEKAPPAKRKPRGKKTTKPNPDATLASFATTDGYSCFICASHGGQSPSMNMQEIMGHGRGTHQLIGENLNEYFVSVMQSFFAAKHSSVNTNTLRGILLPPSNSQAVVQSQTSPSLVLPQGLNTHGYRVSATTQEGGSPSGQSLTPSPNLHPGGTMQTLGSSDLETQSIEMQPGSFEQELRSELEISIGQTAISQHYQGLVGFTSPSPVNPGKLTVVSEPRMGLSSIGQAQDSQQVHRPPPAPPLQQVSSSPIPGEHIFQSSTTQSLVQSLGPANSLTPPQKPRYLQRKVRTASMGSLTLPTISTPPQSVNGVQSVGSATPPTQDSWSTQSTSSPLMHAMPSSTVSPAISAYSPIVGNYSLGHETNLVRDSSGHLSRESGDSSIDTLFGDLEAMLDVELGISPAPIEVPELAQAEQQMLIQQDSQTVQQSSPMEIDSVLFDINADPRASSLADYVENSGLGLDKEWLKDLFGDELAQEACAQPAVAADSFVSEAKIAPADITPAALSDGTIDSGDFHTALHLINKVPVADVKCSLSQTSTSVFTAQTPSTEQTPTKERVRKALNVPRAVSAGVQPAKIPDLKASGSHTSDKLPPTGLIENTQLQSAPVQKLQVQNASIEKTPVSKRKTQAEPPQTRKTSITEWDDEPPARPRAPTPIYALIDYETKSLKDEESQGDSITTDDEEAKFTGVIDSKLIVCGKSGDVNDSNSDSADEGRDSDSEVDNATNFTTQDHSDENINHEESESDAEGILDQLASAVKAQTSVYCQGKDKRNMVASKRPPTVQASEFEILEAKAREDLRPDTATFKSDQPINRGKPGKSPRKPYSDKSPPGKSLKPEENPVVRSHKAEDGAQGGDQDDGELDEASDNDDEQEPTSVRGVDEEDSDDSISDFTPEDADDSDYVDEDTTHVKRRRASGRSTRQTSLAYSKLNQGGITKHCKANGQFCSFIYQPNDDCHLNDDGQQVLLNIEELKDGIFRGSCSFVFNAKDINFSNEHGEKISLETLGWDALNSLSEKEFMRLEELHGSQQLVLSAKMRPEQRITTLHTSRIKLRKIGSVTCVDVLDHEPDTAVLSIENS